MCVCCNCCSDVEQIDIWSQFYGHHMLASVAGINRLYGPMLQVRFRACECVCIFWFVWNHQRMQQTKHCQLTAAFCVVSIMCIRIDCLGRPARACLWTVIRCFCLNVFSFFLALYLPIEASIFHNLSWF